MKHVKKSTGFILLFISRGCTSVSYCMVYAYVREDNPRALASGLSHVHMHSHIITFLLHQHACVLCIL